MTTLDRLLRALFSPVDTLFEAHLWLIIYISGTFQRETELCVSIKITPDSMDIIWEHRVESGLVVFRIFLDFKKHTLNLGIVIICVRMPKKTCVEISLHGIYAIPCF